MFLKLVQNPDGSENLFDPSTGKNIHSRFPKKEASRFLKANLPKKNYSHLIIFGFGLGYHLEEIYHLGYIIKKITVLDPMIELEDLVKSKLSYFINLFQKNNIELQFQFGKVKNILFSKNCSLIALPFYFENFKTEFEELNNLMRNQNLVNQNTKKFFSKIWIRSYLKNIENSLKNPSSIYLMNESFKNENLVFVGGSPSLEVEIDWLKKNKNYITIISSDASAHYLLKLGIRPECILSIDAGRGTYYHFQNKIPKDIPILTTFCASSYLFELENKKIIYFTNYPLDQIIQSTFFPDINILNNSTLNITGIPVSIFKTCYTKSLILLGVDFKDYYGKTHIQGTGYESFQLPLITKKNTYLLKSLKMTKEQLFPVSLSTINLVKNFTDKSKLELKKSEFAIENFSPFFQSEFNLEKLKSLFHFTDFRKEIAKNLHLENLMNKYYKLLERIPN